jgi:hypothetical protein
MNFDVTINRQQPHCHNEEVLGTRQYIQWAPPNKEAKGNQQG